MPADFLANDFAAIARVMRQKTSPRAVLHFWEMRGLRTSVHESVEAAVAEAFAFLASNTAMPVRITTTNGTVVMDSKALAEAVLRYGEEMPV